MVSATLREELPTVTEYLYLREESGLGTRTKDAAAHALPNSIYAVTMVDEGNVIGMGRIVGDDGCFYQIVDIAVVPSYQGCGLGTEIMQTLTEYLHENAPPSAYVSLIADVDGFYEQFGFEETTPDSKGMSMQIPTA
jgi:ribosomal protein S18 acetylase RimI-like enzyme